MSEQKKILVVDDEENYRSLLAKVLTKEGHAVETAESGLAALYAVRQTRFDLALLDIRMTPMDGLEVLVRIKRDSPSTKAIMITAYPSSESRRLAFEKGADDYLMKPVDLQDLKDRVARILPGQGEVTQP